MMLRLTTSFTLAIFALGMITASAQTNKIAETPAAADARLAQFVDEAFNRELQRSPESLTQLGRKDKQDQLDDHSDKANDDQYNDAKATLAAFNQQIDPAALSPEGRVTFKLFIDHLQDTINLYPYRYQTYVIDHMNGIQNAVPSVIIVSHQIGDRADAEAYIARLYKLPIALDQTIAAAHTRAQMGILSPKLTYPKVIKSAQNLITGAPFDSGEDSPFYADFKAKIGKINISDADKTALTDQAKTALVNAVKPGFDRFIIAVGQLGQTATDHGLGTVKDGKLAYAALLKHHTTTDLTPDEIHQFGLSEVAHIHHEMQAVMDQVGFKGSFADFVKKLRTDPQFYYPDSDAGRQAYLDRTKEIVDGMTAKLPTLFSTLPKTMLEVRRVEAFQEGSQTVAYYDPPSEDGSRPGYLYVNLGKVNTNPKYQMEALDYHEGIPGHHLQIALQLENKNIPLFRRLGGYTAYVEGWALYSERLSKEAGFYQDPYSNFGRLSMEAWRACRLVVDTGIHAMGWSREKAIDYMLSNSAESQHNVETEIDRYFVFPGQATSYKIGMREILQLRDKAKTALGDKFDIRAFHAAVLNNGAVPLRVLDETIDDYIAKAKSEPKTGPS